MRYLHQLRYEIQYQSELIVKNPIIHKFSHTKTVIKHKVSLAIVSFLLGIYTTVADNDYNYTTNTQKCNISCKRFIFIWDNILLQLISRCK